MFSSLCPWAKQDFAFFKFLSILGVYAQKNVSSSSPYFPAAFPLRCAPVVQAFVVVVCKHVRTDSSGYRKRQGCRFQRRLTFFFAKILLSRALNWARTGVNGLVIKSPRRRKVCANCLTVWCPFEKGSWSKKKVPQTTT
jgi:hypothetical protein